MSNVLKVQVSDANAARLERIRRMIARLPEGERALWKARVVARLRKQPVSIEVGEDGQRAEWDLSLANWLDGVYGAVSDRVEEVAAKGARVAESAAKTAGNVASSVGFGLWPVAVAAALVLWSLGQSRKAR